MFTNTENHGLVFTITLAGVLIPGLAFSATNTEPSTTRFFSADGKVLSDESVIDPQAPTYLVVHGFQGSGTQDEYLEQAAAIGQGFPKANVVIVDWRPPLSPWIPRGRWDYPFWAAHTRPAGRDVAEWLKDRGIAPSRTVIVGHSLGGQVAASASNQSAEEELSGEPVRAILASDPAGPLFQGQPPETRLDKTDAREVIVVHTTALLGDENAIGTVDIYVSWPKGKEPDPITRHGYARKLVTDSFLDPAMANDDGTPFGVNALGFDFGDGKPRTFQVDGRSKTDPPSVKESRATCPTSLCHAKRSQPIRRAMRRVLRLPARGASFSNGRLRRLSVRHCRHCGQSAICH